MRKVQISITVGALAALYVLGGCGQPGPLQAKPADAATQAKFGSQASVVDLGYRGGKTISLELLPPAEQGFKQFGLLAVQHHWTANDIFLYTATLKVWDGTAYAAIGSGVSTTVDPKAAAPQTKAVFTNLKQGKKYQVGIVATGNDGGTAGTTTLNSANPTNVVYDFTATQDVQDTLSSAVAVTLDPVPFAGIATLAPSNVPAGTTDYAVSLANTDTASTVASGTYLVGQTYKLTNLKIGTHYQVTLTANASGSPLQTAQSAIFYYDPARQDIEQALTIPVAF